jgi:recombinational DNA repair protein (RecF pathway)
MNPMLHILYLEILMKLAQSFHPTESDASLSDSDGIFSVASNAIFYLDQSLEAQSFEPSQQLSLFLVKLLFHLGIMPNLDSCGLCGVNLDDAQAMSFQAGQGHFTCGQCSPGNNERGFMFRMRMSYQTKFQDYQELKDTSPGECDKLIQYFCHQFHLKPIALKSYSLLFK